MSNPSGIPCPTADLPGWKHVFADDFTTDCPLGAFPIYGIANSKTPSAVAAKWTSYPTGYPVTRTKQEPSIKGYYRSDKTITIHDSILDIGMHYDANLKNPDGSLGQYCCAAPIPRLFPQLTAKWQMAEFLHGRWEVCLRQAAPSGTYKIAWLCWPASGGSAGGETDYPEMNLDGVWTAHAFMHYSGGQFSADSHAKLNAYHRFAVEWTPGKMVFLCDGKVIGTATSHVPTQKLHWILQSELVLGNTPVKTTDSVHLQCDWVSFWGAA